MKKNNHPQEDPLLTRLDVIIALLITTTGEKLKPDAKTVKRFSRLGLSTGEIAKLLDTSTSSVSHMKASRK